MIHVVPLSVIVSWIECLWVCALNFQMRITKFNCHLPKNCEWIMLFMLFLMTLHAIIYCIRVIQCTFLYHHLIPASISMSACTFIALIATTVAVQNNNNTIVCYLYYNKNAIPDPAVCMCAHYLWYKKYF